jgi:hypothetical protein
MLVMFASDTWTQLVLDESFDPSSKAAQVRFVSGSCQVLAETLLTLLHLFS